MYCTTEDCFYYLGGSYTPKEKSLDAYLLSTSVASVRKNVAGVPVRVFVDLQENKVRLIVVVILYLRSLI